MGKDSLEQVHVIIPTRNRLVLTRRAVASVRSQTHENWHLTVIDDASDDGSGETLRHDFCHDERVSVVSFEKCRGAPLARQYALDHSDALFIAILDSDDVWWPEKLKKQVSVAAGADVVLCGHEWRTAQTGSLQSTRIPAVRPHGAADPLVSDNMSAPLLRRSALVAAGGFAQEGVSFPTCDGIDLFLRLSKTARFTVVPEVLVTCWHEAVQRMSNENNSRRGAGELGALLDREVDFLRGHPAQLQTLAFRTSARFADAGDRGEALRHVRLALRQRVPPHDLGRALRRYGPFLVRRLLPRVRAGSSAGT